MRAFFISLNTSGGLTTLEQQDPHIAYPRIYNDFFSQWLFRLVFFGNFLISHLALKSNSHLLKLSIAHALAQSTLLAHYEANVALVLTSPLTLSIPTQLAQSGVLQ